jgi:hypothetical protein
MTEASRVRVIDIGLNGTFRYTRAIMPLIPHLCFHP